MSKSQGSTVPAGSMATHSASRMGTRQITVCALLCALNVVLARLLTVMPSAVARFSIEAVPIILAGYFYGPISGMLVGFVGDTVGCLVFSAYGWDPILSVSPMLMCVFAGLLRPLVYSLRKPVDIWRVALTILPGKLLGSVFWTSQCLIWLGYSKKGLPVLMGARALEAGLEWLLDTLVVYLLLRTKVFQRMNLFPPARKESSRARKLRLASGAMVLVQVVVLVAGSLTLGLGFLDKTQEILPRLGNGLLYFLPTLAAAVLFVAAWKPDKQETPSNN